MLRRWILLLGVAAAVCAAGCNDFNTTLGTPSFSSTISFLSPSGANAGGGAFTLTVEGNSFASNSVVEWSVGGTTTVLTTTAINSTELAAQVPSALLATAGTVNILVDTPGTAQSNPSQGINVIETSNVIQFVVQAASAGLPTITLVSPASATGGNVSTSQSATLTISGTGFFPAVTSGNSQTTGSLVYWNGSPVVTYAPSGQNPCAPTTTTTTSVTSATSLTVVVSGCLLQTAETARITVFNPATGTPATGGGSSNTWLYTVGGAGNNARKATSLSLASAFSSAAGSLAPAISASTRYLAFVAPVPDPTIDASTGTDNVYVRDNCAGAPAGCTPSTSLISVAADGFSAADGDSESPSISADGRYVTFLSFADNLAAGGSSGFGDIFVRDTCTGAPAGCTPATSLISVAADGALANGPSTTPSISATGRYVVFSSLATNLISGGAASAGPAIYLRDLCVGAAAGCQPETIQLSVSTSAAASP
jgi:hypothetical protein